MAIPGAVLVVDDDAAFNAALARSLSERGYRVAQALNAKEAERLLRQDRFDVAVVDLNLPDENGIELIRSFHLRRRELRVIATTEVESDLYLEIAAYVGADVSTRKFPSLADGTFPAEEWQRVVADVLAQPSKR